MGKISVSAMNAARVLSCSNQTVINYCRRGILIGERNPVTGVWRIDLDSVYKLLQAAQGEHAESHVMIDEQEACVAGRG